MKHYLAYLAFLFSFLNCTAQKPFGSEYLVLEKEVQLPDVKGRIDHMAVNVKAMSGTTLLYAKYMLVTEMAASH